MNPLAVLLALVIASGATNLALIALVARVARSQLIATGELRALYLLLGKKGGPDAPS